MLPPKRKKSDFFCVLDDFPVKNRGFFGFSSGKNSLFGRFSPQRVAKERKMRYFVKLIKNFSGFGRKGGIKCITICF